MTQPWRFTDDEGKIVQRDWPDGHYDSRAVEDSEVTVFVAKGGRIAAKPLPPSPQPTKGATTFTPADGVKSATPAGEPPST